MKPMAAGHGRGQPTLPWLSMALTSCLVALAVVLSGLWIQQKNQNRQIGNAQRYANALASHVLREFFLLQSDMEQMLNAHTPVPQMARRLLRRYPGFSRIELRDGLGRLLQAFNQPGTDEYWSGEPREVLAPSVQINYTRAMLLQDPLWSRSTASSGHNLIELIRPMHQSDRSLVFIALEEQWQPEHTGLSLDEPAQVSFASPDAPALAGEYSDALSLPGLDLRVIFTPAQAGMPWSLELPHLFIVLLSTALILSVLRSLRESRRLARQHHLLDQQALQIEKISQRSLMGELASTLAHEINQPVAALVNYIAFCEMRLSGSPHAQDKELLNALAQARQQALRAGDVVKSVRQLIAQSPPQPVQLDVRTQIERIKPMLDLICSPMGCRITLRCQSVRVSIDPVLMELVVINLIKNAAEAMANLDERSRSIVLSTRKLGAGDYQDPSDAYTSRFVTEPASHMAIEVTDCGPGVDDHHARSIMEQFFSTKFDHMGIGLSFCRSVAENYGGAIRWTSCPKQGSTFALILPIAGDNPKDTRT